MRISSSNHFLLLSLSFLFFISSLNNCFAQDDWIEYVLMKEKGVMSVSLDLSLDLKRPNYKNLFIVGAEFDNCMKNGFPTENGLEDLFSFSDSTAAAIDSITPNRLVAYLTYQCMAFDIFYVKDTIGLRDHMDQMIKKNFKHIKTYFEIKRDKSWSYYGNYLYPRNFSSEFLVDQHYLHDLVLQGDDLQGMRNVNHWVYFKSLEKRNLFGSRLKQLDFSLDSIAYKRDRPLPYQLNISRQDSIDPQSVYTLTSMMRVLTGAVGGQYDGWSTEVKVKE